MVYTISSTIEGFDNPQFYTGHGHSFEDNLISCLQFQLSVFDPDTVEDFTGQLEDAINMSEWFDLEDTGVDNDLSVLKDLSIDKLFTNQELINWFEETKYQYKEIIDANPDTDLSDLDLDFYLYGYLHIYKETD